MRTVLQIFQDPNQLIRASALRVLSSIRVPVIVPIMMLAIRESVSDMSPYVRKTAAHAIPKLFDLDPEQKDELVTVIEKLLSDQTTLVVGSAVMAFEQVIGCGIHSFYFSLHRGRCNKGVSRANRPDPQKLQETMVNLFPINFFVWSPIVTYTRR